jgi:hypothetical protein
MIDLPTIQQHAAIPGPVFPGPALRGFARMTRDQRDRISSMGGKASQRSGKAHRFTSAEATQAANVKHANRRAA